MPKRIWYTLYKQKYRFLGAGPEGFMMLALSTQMCNRLDIFALVQLTAMDIFPLLKGDLKFWHPFIFVQSNSLRMR